MKTCLITVLCALFAIGGNSLMAGQQSERTRVNVYAIVSENIEMEFMKAARLLHKEHEVSSFPLDDFEIHCTLYMTFYTPDMVEKILEKIEKYANENQAFNIRTSGLEITSSNWFFLNFHINEPLQKLSNDITKMLSPLRIVSDYVPAWAREYPNKIKMIQNFGSPNVFDEFNPHLTFLARGDEDKLTNFMNDHKDSSFAKDIDGKVVAIGVGIADNNGQIKEPLNVFPLNQ